VSTFRSRQTSNDATASSQAGFAAANSSAATIDWITVAYASVPKDSGTFTFYRNIREPLARQGIDFLCVSVGFDQESLWNEAYADEGCVLLAPKTASVKQQAQRFVAWCEEREVDIVLGVNSPAILSAIPHLPADTVALARSANGFDHDYGITVAECERLARVVALVPRFAQDLVYDNGAPVERVTLLPNCVCVGTGQYLRSTRLLSLD